MNTFFAILSAGNTAETNDPIELLLAAGAIVGIIVLALLVTHFISKNTHVRGERIASEVQENDGTTSDLTNDPVLIAILTAAVAASQSATSKAKFRVVAFRRLH